MAGAAEHQQTGGAGGAHQRVGGAGAPDVRDGDRLRVVRQQLDQGALLRFGEQGPVGG